MCSARVSVVLISRWQNFIKGHSAPWTVEKDNLAEVWLRFLHGERPHALVKEIETSHARLSDAAAFRRVLHANNDGVAIRVFPKRGGGMPLNP
jgi:hypothetical protein